MKTDLDTKIIGKKIYHFKTIDSTNLYSKILIKDGVDEGTVVVADVQTSGRGRKDRTWSSPKGGLWFSVILYPNLKPQQCMLLTMAASIAVAQSIKDITNLNPEIKWPNDLLINGKKACGILTEIDAKDDKINYTAVGIGVNVNNQLDEELDEVATSLFKELGTKVSIKNLLESILKNFDNIYEKLISNQFDHVRDTWNSYSKIVGKKIQVQEDNTIKTGTVSDIDQSGHLILDTENGAIRIVSGDVKYL